MMDSFVGLPGIFDTYRNIQTVGEEYPDFPFYLGPPVNLTSPVVTGSALVGSILTTTDGTWSNNPTSFTYQWQNNGVNIGGATSNSYTTQNGDIGCTVTCVVTATDYGGSASASSNGILVTPSSASNPIIEGLVMIEIGLTILSGLTTNLYRGLVEDEQNIITKI